MEDPYLVISKITNLIYLGSYEHPARNTAQFERLKFDVVINCAKELFYPAKHSYVLERFDLDDGPYGSLLEYMDAAVEKIHQYVTEGKKIYIHCGSGVSRAPSILIYYFMVYQKFTFDQAYDMIKELRPVVNINPNFERELRVIEEC